jgi:hypothetical protein
MRLLGFTAEAATSGRGGLFRGRAPYVNGSSAYAVTMAIPKPEKTSTKEFAPAAEEVFDRIMQMTDNAGATDEHRALNYLAVRYQPIYANAADAFARNASLNAVDVASSPLSSTRKVVNVIFSYTNRNTDVVEKFFTRVDVTEEFPFLVTKMSPDR